MAGTAPGSERRRTLKAGTAVEVRNSFDGGWSRGFTIAEAVEGGYRVRRDSDGSILPVIVADTEVRRERRRQTWWV
jgi:hypothetical protein